MAISKELLKILRCPACKAEVKLDEEGTAIRCLNVECGLVYPVKDDIPVMIVEEATKAPAKEDQ